MGNNNYYIGIDLGGTFVKSVVMDCDGKVGRVQQVKTEEAGGGQAIASQIAQGAREVMDSDGLSRDDCLGVGIGSPGPLSPSKGIIFAAPNIPGMVNVPLRDMVSAELDLPAILENDANAAAYGEFLCGAGQGTNNMVLLTLGTGVGSGIIIDGKILHGSHEIGGEMGHIIVEPGGEKCGCGQLGCFERYCSATFTTQYATSLIVDKGRKSSLKAILDEKGSIDAGDINRASQQGDELAVEVWRRMTYYLALGCVNICRLFDPDKIVFAGGMAQAGQDLLVPVVEHLSKLHWSLTDIKTEVVIATLGNDAGAVGAAGVARQALEQKIKT